ncbi:hypothetical protein [Brevibacillus reuszeri]|uniref:hypothetical protein n=1 Tax=Brevibacillus reuszeri TaxID=54915 RepID=UPI000CCC25C1|nr:hypothetical protein [Brevibacillus reuszeri]
MRKLLSKALVILMCVSFLSTMYVERAFAFAPVIAVVGAEGLAILEGIAIRSGIQFASKEAAKTVLKGFVQRQGVSMVTKLDGIAKTAVKSIDSKWVRYSIAGALGLEIGNDLANYIDELNATVDTMPDGTVPVNVPVSYGDAYWGSTSGNGWYIELYGLRTIDGKYVADGVTVNYYNAAQSAWMSKSSTAVKGIAGTYEVQVGTYSAGIQHFIVRYLYYMTMSYKTLDMGVPLTAPIGTVATGDTVLVNEYYPKGKVTTKNPPVVLPFPTTGDMPMVIPSDYVISDPTVLDKDIDVPVDPTVPPGTTNPPWELPKTATINMEPLKLAGDQLTRKFPFSIPWDIKRQLSVFNVEPQTPIIKIDKSIPVFGSEVKLKFDINFSMFDPIAVVVRWFLILAFDIAIVLSIRRLLPE